MINTFANLETDDTISVQSKRLKDQAATITELQHKMIELTAKEESLQSQVVLAKQHAQQVCSVRFVVLCSVAELSNTT